MNALKGRRILLAAFILVILAGSGWWLRARAASTTGSSVALEATGTIEDRKAALASQIGGQVTEVLVEEGQPVKAGQTLVKLDDSLLAAQREIAKANLAAAQSAVQAAQAQYDVVLQAARAQARPARLIDWLGKTPDYFDQPKWYFTQDEQTAAAEAEVQAAQSNLAAKQQQLQEVVSDLNNADFIAAETRLSMARQSYLVALQVQAEGQATGAGLSPDQISRDVLPVLPPEIASWVPGYRLRIYVKHQLPNNADLSDAAQDAYDTASTELSAAQVAYNKLLSSAAAQKVQKARAALATAKERYEVAQDRLNALQTGISSPQVEAAAATLQQAKDAAQQAQANLAYMDVQLKKLTIQAPTDGVVLTRSAEVGQMALPGATLIEVGRLNPLELTVYLPEEKFGLVKVGQAVQVSVDAYPDQVFEGKVLRMANEAEFTPTNVQTKDDRTQLVYAVVIGIQNPDMALKPGMIADVKFSGGASQ